MLKALNLSKIYPKSEAGIHSLSFELRKGQCLVVIGENGSGKTTLLQLLAGFLPADTGTLHLGTQLLPSPADMLVRGYADIQLVPQDFKLLPHHRVWENILFPIRHYSKTEQDKHLANLAKNLGLEDLLMRYPRELSGGQQQRTAIARALANEPSVLLLDEPFNQADLQTRYHLEKTLADLKKKTGVALVLVTHHAPEALGLADEMLVLQKGTVLQHAIPSQVYEQPATPYVAGLFGQVNYFPAKFIFEEKKRNKLTGIRAEHAFFSETPTTLKGVVTHAFYNGHQYRYRLKIQQNLYWEIYTTQARPGPDNVYFIDFYRNKLLYF